MKKIILSIAIVLIVTAAVSSPESSLAKNAVSGAVKKSPTTPPVTSTPSKSPQQSVKGATSQNHSTTSANTKPQSPAKGATPTPRPSIKPVAKPTTTAKKPTRTPTPTMKIVRTAGQLSAYEVSAKSGNTLTVTRKNKSSIKVIILSTTQFKQHYWGSTTLANTAIGDRINVTGTFLDEKKTIMEASLIRNLSILKRRGVTFGTITAITSSNISIQPKDLPIQKVSISSHTKILGQNEKVLVRKDLKVGDRVRVKGLSDRATNTITEVSEIKDFSQRTSTESASIH